MQSSQAKQILMKAALSTALAISCCCIASCDKTQKEEAEAEGTEEAKSAPDQLTANVVSAVRDAIEKDAASAKKEDASSPQIPGQEVEDVPAEKENEAEGPEEEEAPGQQAVVYVSNAAHELFELTNNYRSKADIRELFLDAALCAAAQKRAEEMAAIKKASHVRPDGSSCFSVLDEHGITCDNAGENIAVGYTSAEDAISALCNSSEHYQNIVNGAYSKGGVALAKAADGTHFWVQLFSD